MPYAEKEDHNAANRRYYHRAKKRPGFVKKIRKKRAEQVKNWTEEQLAHRREYMRQLMAKRRAEKKAKA